MGGGYVYISLEDVLVWMGKNCETCHLSWDCHYCRALWDASISYYMKAETAERIGITPTHSICKLKK